MAATVAAEEVKEALKSLWDADPALVAFGQLKEGKLPSPQPDAYAVASVEPGTPQYYAPTATGAGYLSRQRATFTVWCRKDRAAEAGAALQRLDWLPRDGRTLALPDGVTLVSTAPDGEPEVAEDETQKKGTEVWKVVHRILITCARTVL